MARASNRTFLALAVPTQLAAAQNRPIGAGLQIAARKMTNGLLFSHPTGNANVRAALLGLFEAGLLGEFHTTIAAYPGNFWDLLGNVPWGRELRRRTFAGCLRPITVQHPLRELGRMLAGRLKLQHLARHEAGPFCLDAVYQAQSRIAAERLRRHPTSYTGIYAYEDGALEGFAAARELGLRRIYDLPIAYWQTLRQLLAEEAQRLPAWKITLGGGVNDSETKLKRKTKELELAEVVVCPSQFVARSIPQTALAGKKVVVAAFGSPPPSTRNGHVVRGGASKLRVLFAGSMSQRKGLGDLFAAMRLLDRSDVELVVMGTPQTRLEFYRAECNGFIYEPSRPHAEVLELMRSCDVLCLPSIVEGRALVMQEAMSQGLPLIITPNTGGEDLIEEGVTGFLIPIRRADQISEKIAWFADHRTALPEMSRAAQAKAGQLTWNAYGKTIANAILNINQS
jgi:glycosyltransferase involved in cell wall biosynthesis